MDGHPFHTLLVCLRNVWPWQGFSAWKAMSNEHCTGGDNKMKWSILDAYLCHCPSNPTLNLMSFETMAFIERIKNSRLLTHF